MTLPDVVSPDEWVARRKDFLDREKAATRERDRLVADRRRLPMVRVEKDYRFHGEDGEVSLPDLFGGHEQLIVGHFMFDPSWEDGCPSCTAGAEEVSQGLLDHLAARSTAFTYVSRAPLEKILRYKNKMSWSMPWVSSHGSDFNYDFHATVDSSVTPIMVNWRTEPELRAAGMEEWVDCDQPYETNGLSTFLRDGGDVFHTNSVFGRGVESLGGSYYWLDMTALGRQEAWEEPQDRSGAGHSADPNFLS